MLKIYLDMSALNRIFDDQTQTRIFFESSAMIVVFSLVEGGKVELVSSEVHEFENSKNPFPEKKAFIDAVVSLSGQVKKVDEKILAAAERIEKNCGVKGYDALHLASAESLHADYFVTCDDRLIKKYSGTTRAVDPVKFIHDEIYGG